jgi:PBSX family phage terminase large subunit
VTWNFGQKLGDFAFRPIELDRKVTVQVGSVRSGKTWSCQPKMLYASSRECKIAGRKILFGVSKETIYRDVLCDLIDVIGPNRFSRNKQTGEFTICGVPWQMVGARDEGSEKYLRGATIGIAVGHELTLFPQSFFQMLLSRMSPKGARLYGTTNPDNPYHWLKRDIIDNEEMLKAGDLEVIHTTMDDNPNLTAEFVEQQKRQYTGLFYKRFIEGLWVAGEGGIYAGAFTPDLLYDDDVRPAGLYARGGHIARWVAIDYGTVNETFFLDILDDGETFWIDREKVWNSHTEQAQRTDKQHVDSLLEFLSEAPGAKVIVDPSAASFKAEMTQRGIWYADANNDVLDGIRRFASLLAQKKVRVNRRCKEFIKQMEAYAWDERAALRGEEKPIKSNDHGPDCGRYWAATEVPDWRLAA